MVFLNSFSFIENQYISPYGDNDKKLLVISVYIIGYL